MHTHKYHSTNKSANKLNREFPKEERQVDNKHLFNILNKLVNTINTQGNTN